MRMDKKNKFGLVIVMISIASFAINKDDNLIFYLTIIPFTIGFFMFIKGD